MKKRTFFNAMALSAFSVLGAYAQNDSTAIKFEHDSTMNALDHVLQRPNPSPRFENKRFGDHLTISASAGADWTRSNTDIFKTDTKTGYRAGISVGDWCSPVHGWRVGIEGGRHHGVYSSQPYFVALSADYLMNMSSLLRGDAPSRRFELVGLAGIELEGLHRCHHGTRMAAGIHFGLQPRLYVSPTTFVFIEPRLGVYSDNIDYVKTWHKYDWNASVMLGIGYSMNRLKGFRRDNSLFDNSHFRNNMFFGFSGGLFFTGSGTDNLSDRRGSNLNIFAGKWFSAESGLRISIGGGDMRRPGIYRRWTVMGDIDYLWNINSSINGFDPDRRFNTNLALGVSGMLTDKSDHKINPAFHIGVQGIIRLTPALGLTIEPGIRIFGNRLPGITKDRSDIMTSLNIGLVYNTGGGKAYERFRSTMDDNELFDSSRRYFYEIKGGLFMRERVWRANGTVGLAFGKWFSPGNAWRITGEFDRIKQSDRTNYRALTVGLDYIGSITTLACGYNPDRAFDLSAVFGITAGGAHYKSIHNEMVWGPHAGLRASFRASDLVDIVIEPQLRALHIPHSTRRFTPEARLMAGLSFKPSSHKKSRSNSNDAKLMTNSFARNFVNLTGGPSIYSETFISKTMKKMSWAADLTAGRWLTNVSGLQAGVSYDFIERIGNAPELNIGTAHIDYLLNFTALHTGLPDTRFSVVGVLGTGLAWSNRNAGHVSPELNLGLQLRYRFNNHITASLAPSMVFWRHTLNGSRVNNHKFIGVGRVPLSITYSF